MRTTFVHTLCPNLQYRSLFRNGCPQSWLLDMVILWTAQIRDAAHTLKSVYKNLQHQLWKRWMDHKHGLITWMTSTLALYQEIIDVNGEEHEITAWKISILNTFHDRYVRPTTRTWSVGQAHVLEIYFINLFFVIKVGWLLANRTLCDWQFSGTHRLEFLRRFWVSCRNDWTRKEQRTRIVLKINVIVKLTWSKWPRPVIRGARISTSPVSIYETNQVTKRKIGAEEFKRTSTRPSFSSNTFSPIMQSCATPECDKKISMRKTSVPAHAWTKRSECLLSLNVFFS